MANNSDEKKPIFKKWWFWVIVVIIVVAITSSGGTDSNTVINTGTSTDNTQVQQPADKKVNVGGSVQTDEVKISYTACKEFTKYNSYSKPATGNKVMRVQFEFENVSNGDVYLNGFECYADGEKCETYYYADDYKDSTLVSLSKGKKFKATIYYEVPKSAKEVTLEYETDYWSEEKIVKYSFKKISSKNYLIFLILFNYKFNFFF